MTVDINLYIFLPLSLPQLTSSLPNCDRYHLWLGLYRLSAGRTGDREEEGTNRFSAYPNCISYSCHPAEQTVGECMGGSRKEDIKEQFGENPAG
jgi:hypothetical protein